MRLFSHLAAHALDGASPNLARDDWYQPPMEARHFSESFPREGSRADENSALVGGPGRFRVVAVARADPREAQRDGEGGGLNAEVIAASRVVAGAVDADRRWISR